MQINFKEKKYFTFTLKNTIILKMNYICFTTTSCPKCPEFKSFITQNVKFEGEIWDETKPNFMEKISEHDVTAAPTILIFDNGEEVFRTSEIYDLGEFLKSV